MRILFLGVVALSVLQFAVAGPSASPADQILEQYFVIHKSLAADSTEGVSDAAAKIAKMSNEAAANASNAKMQLTAVSKAAAKLQTPDLKKARDEFGDLSKHLTAYLQVAGVEKKPYQFYCSMVKKAWLQPDKDTRNPYYGSSMLKCGELVKW